MKLSPQQTAFLTWCKLGSGSAVLEAVAGAGKTTTLIEAVNQLKGSVALLAYNKKIAKELGEKLEKKGIDWKKAKAGTVHSFGYAAYRKAFPNCKVDDNKVGAIFDVLWDKEDPMARLRSFVVLLVGHAKNAGVGFLKSMNDDAVWSHLINHFDISYSDDESEFPEDIVIAMSKQVLRQSQALTEIIDFDDMVYMPLFKRVRFWQYDAVFLDEAQDSNETRRALVGAILKKGGRVVAVGDRHQAIYGFTGADSDALDRIASDFSAKLFPLTTTFRCPKTVVNFARQWVNHITAHETAPDGQVIEMRADDFVQLKNLSAEDAVLCRNTRPIVELALRMIRNGIACQVDGRDVANNLKRLATRWKRGGINELIDRLDDHLEDQRTILLAKKQELKFSALEDIVETLKAICFFCKKNDQHEVKDVLARIDSLFEDKENVTRLMTIHRSKGLEFERVFWYDRVNTCPSKWARQSWQQEQERNLMYVAATRAKKTLVDLQV